MINNFILRKGIAFLLILTLICSGSFLYPEKVHAQVIEQLVTKYHLDIGVQQIWGTEDKNGTIIWDDDIGPNGEMLVSTSISLPKEVYNVKAYPYSSTSFKWNDPEHYTSNMTSEDYYNNYYRDFASSSITVKSAVPSGKTVSFSYKAKMNSIKEYDLTQRLNWGQIDEVFSLMAGPYSLDPEGDVKKNFPDLYKKLNAGRNGVDPKVHAYMFFCPVIIQYDVKEVVELPDPEEQSVTAKLQLPSSAEMGQLYNAADVSIIGSDTTVKSAKLYRTIDGEKALIDTYPGTGRKGQNTGGVTSQSYDKEATIKYELVVTSTSGLEDTDTKTITIEDGRSFAGDVNLEVIPNITHEGHPVDAIDCSTYTVTEKKESKDVSAAYAYSHGFASNKYLAPDGKVQKDDYDAVVTFPKKGIYPITLEVKLKGHSDRLTDTKNVEVLKTPYIYDTLSGFQKQNRKQILKFRIATYPGKPITKWDLSIKDLKSNEMANLDENNLVFVGDCIKTRTTKYEVLSDYWTEVTVEFLTKYPRYSLTGITPRDFSYKLKVEDSKGDTDDVYKGFPVAPDVPPIPHINLQSVYTRNQGTNTATIETECLSESDGDSLERTWSVAKHSPLTNLAEGQTSSLQDIPESSYINAAALPNYKKIGFGTDQKITFDKEGVGLTTVKLHLKDVWTEPTLEEFISPRDYLEGETTAKTNLVNIAPVVSIYPLDLLKANILLLTNKSELTEERKKENELNVSLMEKNIDGNISINEVENNQKFSPVTGYKTLYNSETYLYAVSNSDATHLRAYDSAGNIKWRYNILQEDKAAGVIAPTIQRFCVDQKENYGVLIYQYYKGSGQILTRDITILNAKTGVPIKTYEGIVDAIPTDIKAYLNNGNNILYMMVTPEQSASAFGGIWKLDMKTGSAAVLDKNQFYMPRILEGKLAYIKKFSTVSYGINYINLKTEEVTTKMFPTFRIEKYPMGQAGDALLPVLWDSYDTVFFESKGGSITANAKTGSHFIYNTYYSYGDPRKSPPVNVIRPRIVNTNFVLDKYGRAVYYYQNVAQDYYDKNKVQQRINTCFFRLTDNQVVSWEECQEIVNKIKQDEYIKAADVDTDTDEYNMLESIKKYALLDENNTYLIGKNIGEYGEKVANFIKDNGIRLLDTVSQTIAEAINGDLTEKRDYALHLKGDSKNNMAEISKKVNVDSGKTYKYSYNMNVVSGTPADLLSVELLPTVTSNGKTYYKEVIYKEDLTRGQVPNSPYVSYTGGKWAAGGKYDYYAGYGSGQTGKNSNTGGPSIEFYLEKDGYIDLELYVEDSASFFYFDGDIEKFNRFSERTSILKLVKAGTHTIKMEDDTYYNDYGRLIQSIELGYVHETDGIKTQSSLSQNNDGSYQVNGLLTMPNDILYNEFPKEYIQLTQATFTSADVGILADGSKYNNYGIIGEKTKYFELNGIGDSRNNNAYISPTGNGFNCGGSGSQSFDLKLKNPTNSYMIVAFEWNGSRNHATPKISVPIGECQSLTSGSSPLRGAPYSDKVHKIWVILPPNESGSIYTKDSYDGGYWSVWNFKYGFIDAQTVKGLMAPNIKLDEATKDGFFSRDRLDGTDYSLVNVVDMFSRTDGKISITRYNNMTQDTMDLLKLSTTKSIGIDAYISNLSIKEVNSKNGASDVLQNRNFNFPKALENNNWAKTVKGTGIANIELAEKPTSEDDTLVYKKGELIKYGINYSDYETDPQNANKSYWIYAHTPYNDGENSDAAILYDEDGNIIKVCGQDVSGRNLTIKQAVQMAKENGSKTLTESIPKFYIDGKYTVFHWEFDDTSRGSVPGGYPAYDKESNTADLTFYVQGLNETAPWITGISTSPDKVTENNYFSINVGMDDLEKDVLSLTTEVYKEKKLIFTHRKKNIYPLDFKNRVVEPGGYEYTGNTIRMADPDTGELKYFARYKYVEKPVVKTGATVKGYNEATQRIETIPLCEAGEPVKYPVINTGALPDKAQGGKYEVVCTVRDQTGAGIGSYSFIVVSEGKITGQVYHTDQWETNRKKYNLNRFKDEINRSISYSDYLKLKEPRARGTNVFWSGEKFMLTADVAGSPSKVTCAINGTSYQTAMKSTGRKNAQGETQYTGSLWDKAMINRWGRKEPEELNFTFTATYGSGLIKKHEVKVIVDNMDDYWKLHRVF